MSGNIGKNNEPKIIRLQSGRTFDLKKLDKLIGETTVGSIFSSYDENSKGGNENKIFDTKEIALIKEKLLEYQQSDNNVSDGEIQELLNEGEPNSNLSSTDFETLLTELEKAPNDIDILQSEQPEDEAETPTSKHSDTPVQTLTKYTVQPGDTPLVIAQKLGLTGEEAKEYAQKLKQHFKDNGYTNHKGWLNVGDNITLLGDYEETISSMSDYTTDRKELNARYAASEHGMKIKEKAAKKAQEIPEAVNNRLNEIKKSEGTAEIIRNNDGTFTLRQTSGKGYFERIKASRIELLFDANGQLIKQTNYLKNGVIKEGTFKDGEMVWKDITPKDIRKRNFENLGFYEGLPNYNDQFVLPSDNTRVVRPNYDFIPERNSKEPTIIDLPPSDNPAEGKGPLKPEFLEEKPKKLEDLTPQEKFLYLKPMERSLPEPIQDRIIQLRLDGHEVIFWHPISKNHERVGYEIEFKKNTGSENVNASYLNSFVYSPENISAIKFDLDGNIISSHNESEELAIFKQNEVGKKVAVKEESFKPIENTGRMTTDTYASDINIIIPERLQKNGDCVAFAKSLMDKKTKTDLMEKLNLTNEEYDNLAALSMAIAEQETHFNQYIFEEQDGDWNIQGRLMKKHIADLLPFYDIKSKGITQIRWALNFEGDEEPNKTLRAQANSFGIKGESDYEDNPEKAAILTMILLNNKRLTVENETWQKRLEKNNANIPNEVEKLTNNDIIALLWNGAGHVVKRMENETITINTRNSGRKDANGEKIKDGVSYSYLVRAYYEDYEIIGINTSYTDKKGAIPQDNSGQIGSVIFLANRFNGELNQEAIEKDHDVLEKALKENKIPLSMRQPLLNAVKNGEISFGYGLSYDEAKSITSYDIMKLLGKLGNLKTETESLVDPKLIRQRAEAAGDEFRASYLKSKSFTLNNSDIDKSNIISTFRNPEIYTGERTYDEFNIVGLEALTKGKTRSYEASISRYENMSERGERIGFAVERDLGVNPYDANGKRIYDGNIKLAEAAQDVAKAMGTGGRCATGFKTALATAGIEKKENFIYPKNVMHRVQEGQSFLDIAKSYGYDGVEAEKFAEKLKTRLIKQAKIDNNGKLIPGKTITLEDCNGIKVRHTIKEGETLETIVRQYGHWGMTGDKYALELYKELVNSVTVDTNGNLIAGKKIAVHQKGEIINNARDLYKYFDANPEKFEQVKYVNNGDGTSREINASDITNLPAGYIIIFIPGKGFENQSGHAVITNGHGQGYADEVDNLRWDDYKSSGAGNGKGEHGTYKIYRLKAEA